MVTESDDVSTLVEAHVNRFAERIRGVVHRYGLPSEDLDEVVQDVRVRLWRALRSREKKERLPASYVYRAAVSATLDLIRRRRVAWREDPLESPMGVEVGTPLQAGPEAALETSEVIEAIDAALHNITETRQVVVRMHLAGYQRNEIANRLGWTEAKTRNLLYRGLEELRVELKQRGIWREGA